MKKQICYTKGMFIRKDKNRILFSENHLYIAIKFTIHAHGAHNLRVQRESRSINRDRTSNNTSVYENVTEQITSDSSHITFIAFIIVIKKPIKNRFKTSINPHL